MSTDPCDVHLIDVSPPDASGAPQPAGDHALLDQALQIADAAMFQVLQASCTDQSGDGLVLGFTDENCCEVTTLFKADERLVEAFEWLRGRGYVQLDRDGLGEHVIVLRRLGE